MPTSLDGLRILVTRPHPKGEALCAYLAAQGAGAIHLPTIAFAEPKDRLAFTAALSLLGQQDYLIFISPQAVHASIAAIRQQWPHFPPHVQFAAVGGGTAAALQQAGYQISLCPVDDWRSEGLLALPTFQALAGKKIAIIRGEGGRAYLEQTLAKRGADVLPLVAYQRILPTIDVKYYQTIIQQQVINVIIATSFESVKNLKLLLGEIAWPIIKKIPMLVMSERIKILAEDLGFQTIWVAAIASNEATLKALQQKREEICQITTMKL